MYHYDSNGRLIAETGNAGDTLREYLYLNGQLLVMEAKEQITVGGDEIIVDNGSGATSTTGTWTNKASGSAYNGSYELASSNNTPSTYRWTPSLTAGDYEVYAWWVSSGGYSNNVPYTIAHNGQTSTVSRSHKSGGGQWDLLGSWTFDGSGSEYIEISNANGKASADGIRLVKALSTVTQVNRYYVHNDHLGTPQSVTNDSGQEVWRADYRPFGDPTINADVDGDANTLVMNVRFPGQYYDAESGNHYNYFRDYNPSVGRYIQSDPIGLEYNYQDAQIQLVTFGHILHSDELNILSSLLIEQNGLNYLYSYANQNPLTHTDRLGLSSEKLWIMREAARTAQTIAQGNKIRKVEQLCEKWGGKPKDWKKQKGWDALGEEYHWYSKKGSGKKYGWKRAGEPDPF